MFLAADNIVIQEGCKEVHFTWTVQAGLPEYPRFTILDAVSEGIRLASQCRFQERGKVAHIVGGTH
jgi:hypothetical protein